MPKYQPAAPAALLYREMRIGLPERLAIFTSAPTDHAEPKFIHDALVTAAAREPLGLRRAQVSESPVSRLVCASVTLLYVPFRLLPDESVIVVPDGSPRR